MARASRVEKLGAAVTEAPVPEVLPRVSIVIPARDSERTLPETLQSCRDLTTTIPYEVVVVDDGSSDGTAAMARSAGARVVPCEGRGVADARNTGARHARGEVILFADSDVVLPPDAVDLVAGRILRQGYDAVTGRLSRVTRDPAFASQYKNLWMSYTYETLPDEVALFYTSAAAIKRSVFLELGGFDASYRRPSVEDTAFGQVLGDRGYRVRAEKRLAVEHLKAYTPREVLALDYARARGLTRVFAGRGRRTLRKGNSSSVPTEFILSVPLPVIALLSLLLAAALGSAELAAAAAALLILFFGLNGGFLSYLLRQRGVGFFLRSHLFLIADAFAVTAGCLSGLLARGAGNES